MKKIILFQTDVGYYCDVLSSPDLPLGLLKAASFLSQDHKIIIIDARLDRKWKNTLDKELRAGEVICIGVTVMLGSSIKQGLEASAYVKKYFPDIKVIWGGKNSTLAAEDTLKEGIIDIVVRGEAEEVFDKLVRKLEKGKSYADIKGISFINGLNFVHNPVSQPLNLDELPRLPYELIDVRKYQPKMGGRRSLNYESSRGCPIGCPFCYNNISQGRIWRGLSTAKVINDILLLKEKYGVEHIYFVDDNLFCDIERLKEIACGLIRNKCEISWDTQGACLRDVDALTDAELQLLKDSGLVRLAIGVQTGSDNIRKLIESSLTDTMILGVNEKLKKFNIKPHYYFMMAFPGETQEDRMATVRLALNLLKNNRQATTSSFFCFAPWPGTRLFELAQSEYGLKKPKGLSYWIREWDFSAAPWLTDKDKFLLHNLFLVSMFYDNKSDWYSDSRIVKFISALYRPLAKYRVQNMNFNYMFEAKLISWGKAALKYF